MTHAEDLFQLAEDLLCVADTDGYFLEVNPSFERVLGWPPGELTRKPFVDFVHPEDREATLREVERLRGGRTTLRFENRYRCADGSYVWLDWTCHPDTKRGLLFAIARDATARRAMEERLLRAERSLRTSHRELENRYEAVVRASGQLLFDWDPKTNDVTYLNSEVALGYTDGEMAGGLDHWLTLVHPADRAAFEKELGRVTATEESFQQEYRVRKRDGTYIHVEDRGYFFRGADGEISRMVGFVVDITARKELEAQLRQSQKMEAVGRLAGGIAHDFNNLLTAILGYSDLLLARLPEDNADRADIGEIKNAGERARSLTRQLLAFSRKQLLQPRVLDLNAVVRRMDELLRRVIGEDVELETRLAPDLDPVRFDPGHLEQIVMNLAVNARDAMRTGGRLTLATDNVTLDGPALHGRFVRLAVTDTGAGMDADTRHRIFEPFFTTKEHGQGTGLGLAMVYGLVKQSGGEVAVESEPGRGTTFRVFLPCTDEDVSTEAEPGAAPTVTTGTETILLVEDEDVVRRLIAKILEDGGYAVLTAGTPREARERCRRHPGGIDLLLTDVVLPEASGRQLAGQLLDLRPELKVLYMSGYTADAIGQHGVLASDVAFLQKPMTPAALLAKVREVLG